MNPIVTVNVSQTSASLPDNLQQTGAMVSQGGTNTAAGTVTLITEPGDLTAVTPAPKTLSALSWLAGTATGTSTAPHGIPIGDTMQLVIAGALPAGYNGTRLVTSTGASTFTYPLASDPGAATAFGTYLPLDVSELNSMVSTFFAQGSQQVVYVLELGPGDTETGVAALDTFITASPQQFYRYLVPRVWADSAAFITFLAGFNSTTAKTYFHVTMTVDNYTDFPATLKCVFGYIDAPDAPDTEFGSAWPFWALLHLRPSATNKVTPTAFNFGFGITPYPIRGNNALFTALKAAFVNWAGTGAEGGISNVILFWGTTMDGRDGTYWYSVDWVQINLQRGIAGAIINGSNNPVNPLYYDQNGIDRLQNVAAGVLSSAVSFGLAVGTVRQVALTGAVFDVNLASGDYAGQCVVNAIPFVAYLTDNPGDYAIGRYGGFAAVYTASRGFTAIIFNLNVTDFVAQ